MHVQKLSSGTMFY